MDQQTEIEEYNQWIKTVNDAWKSGWRCYHQWIFISPSGTYHDLSAADLLQLSRIEKEGLFKIEEKDVKS